MLTRKKIKFSLILLIFLAMFAASCGQKNTSDFSQTENGIQANLNISPSSPVAMEMTKMMLTLIDGKGQPIEGADVQYNLVMPGMMMAPNQPQASEESGGRYRADAMFTMAGDWRVEVSVQTDNRETTFNFDFPVK
jgi:hypothetical protein